MEMAYTIDNMTHKINIQPTDTTLTPPPAPDRSHLSNLYVRSAAVTTQELAATQEAAVFGKQVGFIDMRVGRVTLLLTLPVIATFLNAEYVLVGQKGLDIVARSYFPLISFSLTAGMLLVWIICMKKLISEFRNYDFSLSMFLVAYLFYALPLVNLIFIMSPKGWLALSLCLGTYGVASCLVVTYMSRILRSNRSTDAKMRWLALPVVVLVLANIAGQ
jgi:hypothetical protein